VTLTASERLQVDDAVSRLKTQFASKLEDATIERVMSDSVERLTRRASTGSEVPVRAEQFARDRLRALARDAHADADGAPSVMFLCVHNAGRSQMAAGLMRRLSGDRIDVYSGGSEPADQVNRAAVAVMAEIGIDISGELPQPWADEIVRSVDVVVTMGCGDSCPVFPGKRYVDWVIEDPSGKPVEEVRPIRDDLEERVRTLMSELSVPAQG
jgi:protein-tyrosine-phosphatase